MNLRPLVSLLLAGAALSAAPAMAQHQGHSMPMPAPAPAPSPAQAPQQPDPHAGHAMPDSPAASDDKTVDPHAGHAMPEGSMPAPDAMAGMKQETMDHSTMDHSTMDDAMPASPGPEMETPPPPEAGSGPPRAADAIWGADAMRASRDDLRRESGDFPLFWFQGDRLEVHAREGANDYIWDFQGYYGGPTSRFWFKTEGEGAFGGKPESAEFQALYSRAIRPFWDLQAGVRQDLAGPDTTYAVLGIQGVAPYLFQVDAAAFVSQRGDVTARIEAELDQRITQRLIFQPRVEINMAAQDIPILGVGAGIDKVEAGLRLRYEIIREFAPYVGIEQTWRIGNGADFARARGEDPSATNYVFGIRFWF